VFRGCERAHGDARHVGHAHPSARPGFHQSMVGRPARVRHHGRRLERRVDVSHATGVRVAGRGKADWPPAVHRADLRRPADVLRASPQRRQPRGAGARAREGARARHGLPEGLRPGTRRVHAAHQRARRRDGHSHRVAFPLARHRVGARRHHAPVRDAAHGIQLVGVGGREELSGRDRAVHAEGLRLDQHAQPGGTTSWATIRASSPIRGS
jgi:hypothetical protein